MLRNCTYLKGKKSLPKNSILYSEYMVLNELNNLKINDEPLSVKLKLDIYDNLFKKGEKVTKKKLENYLKANNHSDKETRISGIDGDFKSNLFSFAKMQKVLGDKFDEKMAEDIIRLITIFGDDKEMLGKEVQKEHDLSDNVIKEIKKLKFSGWGRLSKEFLTEIKSITDNYSIIEKLTNTNDNLMQILSDKNEKRDGFNKSIEEENKKQKSCNIFSYNNLVKDLYLSPSVKRGLWQTLLVIKETVKIMGKEPKKVFIEMARGNTENQGKTKSRKDKLKGSYKSCEEDVGKLQTLLEGKTDSDLRSKRLYLYFLQQGKCMYTGNIINLENLFDKNLYDIDHIIPQAKIKDDSFNNLVLVEKSCNSNKTDIYPLPAKFRQELLWINLYKSRLMEKEKFDRLRRVAPLKEDELSGFIARQIVQTRQSSKECARILKEVLPKSDVVYVKASNVSDFRNKFSLVKVRDLNDLHHAKDAFLNIVVGNVYDTKFTKSPINFIKNSNGRDYNFRTLYNHDVKRGDVFAWQSGDNGTISHIKDIMKTNRILFTRYSHEKKGGFYDQQPLKKGHGQIPLKGADKRFLNISKYGAYNKESGAYFFLVKHDKITKKGETVGKIKTIEDVPLRLKNILKSKEALEEYCINQLHLINPQILIEKIKINTLFKVNGFLMHLSGKSGKQLVFKHAHQLILTYNDKKQDKEQYIKKITKFVNNKKITKFVNNKKINPNIKISEKYDGINKKENLAIYDVFLDKLKNTVYNIKLSAQVSTLENNKENFINLSLEEQCEILCEILKFFKCNRVMSNIKKLVGSSKDCKAGNITLNKNITEEDKIELIHQSPTGIFEKKVNLALL